MKHKTYTTMLNNGIFSNRISCRFTVSLEKTVNKWCVCILEAESLVIIETYCHKNHSDAQIVYMKNIANLIETGMWHMIRTSSSPDKKTTKTIFEYQGTELRFTS